MTPAPTVAALYVETNGVYYGLDGVDPWDEQRDARLYDGPWPVVAHPPCNVWSIMANCRPEIVKDDDQGCFESALNVVRTFGGVLEHPRHTRAWKRYGLQRPMSGVWSWPDEYGGRVTEVDQRHYGHPCRKATWIYYVGPEPEPLATGEGDKGEPIFSPDSKRGQHANTHNNHAARSRSPEPFRDLLLSMARSAVREHQQ